METVSPPRFWRILSGCVDPRGARHLWRNVVCRSAGRRIGLRMALGAGSGRVLAMILKEGMILTSIGVFLGLLGAYGVGKAMHSIFYKVGTIDFALSIAVAAVLLLAAFLACFIPARRATLVAPMQALRED